VPASSRSNVVLPAPFAPTTAIRSPGPTSHDTSRSSTRPPRVTDTPASSNTWRPSRAVASRRSDTSSRTGGTSAMSSLAASMRNFGLLVRAGGPRRNQAISLRSRFCRRASAAAACRARSARASVHAAYPPS
jgi:hypothetical protein